MFASSLSPQLLNSCTTPIQKCWQNTEHSTQQHELNIWHVIVWLGIYRVLLRQPVTRRSWRWLCHCIQHHEMLHSHLQLVLSLSGVVAVNCEDKPIFHVEWKIVHNHSFFLLEKNVKVCRVRDLLNSLHNVEVEGMIWLQLHSKGCFICWHQEVFPLCPLSRKVCRQHPIHFDWTVCTVPARLTCALTCGFSTRPVLVAVIHIVAHGRRKCLAFVAFTHQLSVTQKVLNVAHRSYDLWGGDHVTGLGCYDQRKIVCWSVIATDFLNAVKVNKHVGRSGLLVKPIPPLPFNLLGPLESLSHTILHVELSNID